VKQHRFLREALEEYEDAIAHYERLRPGLRACFILDLDQAIAITLEFPESGSPVDRTPSDLGIQRRLPIGQERVRVRDFESS
jgi:plasmid stabilization system protein ParE